ncbi:MAG TPA: (4Fe-4S)-binding protein, partial [Armatimonadetes bacterium]|nr:(4Fe-4S)-binding protein [Armatimonadota bacterium]
MTKQIVVLSGKGGTGKTTVTASLTALIAREMSLVIADCDVDAPNLHFLLSPRILHEEDFVGAKLAEIDRERCIECGECAKVCRFDAIRDMQVRVVKCSGCGVCAITCPAGAIAMREQVTGKVYLSETKYGMFSHARLQPASEGSGMLVTMVRQQAERISKKRDVPLLLIDGPPGIGCTATASLTGTDLTLIVTEPTLSGIHDMERVLGLARHFRVPALICINQADLNPKNTAHIYERAREWGAEVISEIPFDRDVPRSILARAPLV